jgi:hypothetical protein
MDERVRIEEFLGQKRIAFVGLSSDPRHFSHAVWKEMRERGYELVPVHPTAKELEGVAVFASVEDIPEPVGGALLMTPPAASASVVAECADAGILRVWLHRGVGHGSVTDDAIAMANARGLDLVAGQCPLMFLRDPAWIHRAHAWAKKLVGTYPAS